MRKNGNAASLGQGLLPRGRLPVLPRDSCLRESTHIDACAASELLWKQTAGEKRASAADAGSLCTQFAKRQKK